MATVSDVTGLRMEGKNLQMNIEQNLQLENGLMQTAMYSDRE